MRVASGSRAQSQTQRSMKAMYSSRASRACAALVTAHKRSNSWIFPIYFGFRCNNASCCHSIRLKASATHDQQVAKQCPRFYAPQLPCSVGAAVELDPEEAKHALKVLRLKQGDALELCDGQGNLVQCEVAFTHKNTATVVATAAPSVLPWQGPKWVVAAACLTLKGGRTDWLIEKATELGAYALLPLVTDRSQTGTTKAKFKSLSSKNSTSSAVAASASSEGDFQPGRMQRLALAATKQSLRAHALQLLPVTALNELLPALQKSPINLVATAGAPAALQVLQRAHLQKQPSSAADLSWEGKLCYLLIGPEGDFTPSEVQSLEDAGVLPVGLGSNRLRTETAALALLAAAVLHTEAAAAGYD